MGLDAFKKDDKLYQESKLSASSWPHLGWNNWMWSEPGKDWNGDKFLGGVSWTEKWNQMLRQGRRGCGKFGMGDEQLCVG